MRCLWLVIAAGITPFAEALLRLKLQNWFPEYESRWIAQGASCQQELLNYLTTNRTAECHYPCACAADCFLQDLPPTIQSNFASAQVLLGLTPAILAYFGPTLAETAVFSTYRPLLAVLLSLGSPAISLGRLFGHVDLGEPFARPASRSSRIWSDWLSHQSRGTQAVLRVSIYMFALAAIANNVHTSVYTDLRTISGWRCGAIMMPLAWSGLAAVVHSMGMIAIRVHLENEYRLPIMPAVQSTILREGTRSRGRMLCEVLLWLASFLAIIHMVFGILVLSSLIFISTIEALQIFARYAASAVACQLVLLVELTMMRHELRATREMEAHSQAARKSDSELTRAHTI